MEVGDHPCVWTDGSLEPYPLPGFFGCCCCIFLRLSWRCKVLFREWLRSMGMPVCRAFMLVPDPLQTVQRAEFWGTILALQAFGLVTWRWTTLMCPVYCSAARSWFQALASG